ncbi:WG repeat-containing protein [Actinoplanes sp. NPDC049316]|uniref:WG repeat-containing protein n=1 Tax=Actinoplanes sp. NPDC049316 TaxID=3154727 RepID=UPI00342E56C8
MAPIATSQTPTSVEAEGASPAPEAPVAPSSSETAISSASPDAVVTPPAPVTAVTPAALDGAGTAPAAAELAPAGRDEDAPAEVAATSTTPEADVATPAPAATDVTSAEAAESTATAADGNDEPSSTDVPVADEVQPEAEAETPSRPMAATADTQAAEADRSTAPASDDAVRRDVATAADRVAMVERPADEAPEGETPTGPGDRAGEDEGPVEVVVDVPVAVVDAEGEVVEAEVVEPDVVDADVDEPVAVEVAPADAHVPVAAEPPVNAEIIEGAAVEEVPGSQEDAAHQDVPHLQESAPGPAEPQAEPPAEPPAEPQAAPADEGAQQADEDESAQADDRSTQQPPEPAADQRPAETAADESSAETAADESPTETAAGEGAADEPAGGGLGWLLSMSGLGAVTADPDSIPVSPAVTPVSAAPVPEPVSAAPVRTDWFSPSAENQIVTPRETTDEPAETETPETETPETRTPETDTLEAETPEERPAETETTGTQPSETAAAETPAPETEAVESEAERAVRAPSMQLPTLSVPPPPEPELEPVPALPDPEQLLAAYAREVDPVTLRETVAEPDRLRALRDRLTDRLEYAERDSVRAWLLSLRAVVSRLLGEYGRALADGRESLRHAEATGDLRQIAVVQARLAQVQQWRGDFAEADRLYEEANSVELPGRLRAEMHVNAGKSCYEQGRYLEACNHFELALELRRVEDPDLVARTEAALDAVMARVQEAGWGPYPRSREEILQQSRPPQPASDYETGLVGYADGNGDVVIPESFADAQPFREGAAWVRRPHAAAWELIDETGALLIDESSAYLQALPFSDGLAWVSRDPVGGWFAVDWHNRVIVPGGFDDVRPFRRGVAPVLRGGWGAIDRHGRIMVQPKYRAFATELSAGGPVDGFTEEGLAVVDAGDRYGVVDRTGQLRVPPVHARLIVHPAAYIVGDWEGRWGALDRDGEPMVDVTHRDPAEVVQEIERKVSDNRPVL